jgi:hypothetical protein
VLKPVEPDPAPAPKRKASRRGRVGEGRPSKCTAQTAAAIAEAIADGLNDGEAALVAGVDPHTLSRWRKGDPEFCSFLKRAEALRLQQRLRRIESAEPGWQSLAWLLERTLPQRYGRRGDVGNQVLIAQHAAGPAREIVVTIPDEEFQELASSDGYAARADGALQRDEGSRVIILVKQSASRSLLPGARP